MSSERAATVVVVDDTPDLRLLLRMVLELSERYTVVAEAGDGRSGIEAVRQWQPDLVLLDLAMPIMDGLEALPGIIDACPAASVVVLSGFEADRMTEQAIDRGAAAYLQKGTRPDDVVAALDEVLGRPHGDAREARTAEPTVEEIHEIETLRTALATAAHELRTPATVLIGLAQTLIKKRSLLDPARMDQMLDAIVRQTRVVDRLTADLLTSTQATRGGLTAQVEPMDVVPALHAAAFAVSDQSDVTVTSPEALVVIADPVRVQQMLVNLISNALKYAALPISVTATASERHAVIQVDDSGDGVPAEFRAHLFDQYSRATGSRAAGTGLGLYVVRALAEAQDGTAWYEPKPGHGSSFFFTLPRG